MNESIDIMFLGVKLTELCACTFRIWKAQRYTVALNVTLFISLKQAEKQEIIRHLD